QAEREFKRALELNPNYPTAHYWYASFLSAMARHQEAIAEAQQAQKMDPTSIQALMDLSRAFYQAREYDQAIATVLKVFELDPNYHRMSSWLELSYEQKGLYDQAIAEHFKAMTITGTKPETIAMLKDTYAVSGWRGYWQKQLDLIQEAAQRRYVQPYFIARICARLE